MLKCRSPPFSYPLDVVPSVLSFWYIPNSVPSCKAEIKPQLFISHLSSSYTKIFYAPPIRHRPYPKMLNCSVALGRWRRRDGVVEYEVEISYNDSALLDRRWKRYSEFLIFQKVLLLKLDKQHRATIPTMGTDNHFGNIVKLRDDLRNLFPGRNSKRLLFLRKYLRIVGTAVSARQAHWRFFGKKATEWEHAMLDDREAQLKKWLEKIMLQMIKGKDENIARSEDDENDLLQGASSKSNFDPQLSKLLQEHIVRLFGLADFAPPCGPRFRLSNCSVKCATRVLPWTGMESSWRSVAVVNQMDTATSRRQRSPSSTVSSSSPTSTSWQLSIRNEGEATFSPASTPISGGQGGGLDLDLSPSAQSTASTTASLQMAGSDVDDVNAENRGTPRDDQYGHGSRNTVINTDASKVSSHDDSRNDSEFVHPTHKRSSSSSSSLSSPNVTLKIDNMLDRVRDCLEVDDRTNASDLTSSRSATTTVVEDDKLTFFSPRPDFAFDTMLSPVSKNTDEGERGRAIMAELKMKNPNYLLNRLSTITLDIREFLAPDRWTLASSMTAYSSAGSGRHSSTTNINTASSTASLGVSVSSFVLDLSFSLGLCIPPVEAVEISVRSCIVEEHRGRLSESAAAPVPGTKKGEEVGSAFLETQRQDARSRTPGSQGKSLEERQHCITEQSWEFPVGGGNLLSTQPRSRARAAPTQADGQVDVASAGDGANIKIWNAGATVERGQNGWLCTRPEKLSPVAQQQQQVVKGTNSTSSTDCKNTPLTLDQDVWHTQIIGSFSEILAPGGCDLAEPAGTTGPRGGQLSLRELETTTRGRPSANLLRKLEVRLKSKNFCGKSPVPMECFSVYLPVVSES